MEKYGVQGFDTANAAKENAEKENAMDEFIILKKNSLLHWNNTYAWVSPIAYGKELASSTNLEVVEEFNSSSPDFDD